MKKYAISIGVTALSLTAVGQIVSTITDTINASGGMSLGQDNQIYVADFGASLNLADGSSVYKVNANDGASLLTTGLNGGKGNDFGPDGWLYQANVSDNSIVRINTDGILENFVSEGLFDPSGVYVNPNGDVFVATCSGSILKIENGENEASNYAFSPLFVCPKGITGDGFGNLYVTNFSTSDVLKIDDDANVTLFATLPGTNNGHIDYCQATESLYATSHSQHQLFRIDMEGNYEIIAGNGARGNDDGPVEQATFSRPNGIAVSVTGDTLFVNSSIPTSDEGFPLNPSVVRMITGLNTNATSVNADGQGTIIRLFPNPVRDELYMELPHPLKSLSRVWIVDSNFLLKKELNQFSDMTSRVAVDVSHWATGMYFVILEHDRQRWIEKILVY